MWWCSWDVVLTCEVTLQHSCWILSGSSVPRTCARRATDSVVRVRARARSRLQQARCPTRAATIGAAHSEWNQKGGGGRRAGVILLRCSSPS